jgi:hypothetical protein
MEPSSADSARYIVNIIGKISLCNRDGFCFLLVVTRCLYIIYMRFTLKMLSVFIPFSEVWRLIGIGELHNLHASDFLSTFPLNNDI